MNTLLQGIIVGAILLVVIVVPIIRYKKHCKKAGTGACADCPLFENCKSQNHPGLHQSRDDINL